MSVFEKNPEEPLPKAKAAKILDHLLFRWAIWVARMLHITGGKSGLQLFYFTLYNRRFGASMNALRIQSKTSRYVLTDFNHSGLIGVHRMLIPASTFKDRLKAKLELLDQKLEARLSDIHCPRVHWVDNFATIYIRNMGDCTKEVLQNIKYTVCGTKFPQGSDFAHIWRGGAVVEALPAVDVLFSDDRVSRLLDVLDAVIRDQYALSTVATNDIKNWPLKWVPNPKQFGPYDELLSTYTERSTEGVDTLFPTSMLPFDPARQDGLLATLSHLQGIDGFATRDAKVVGRYSAVCSDPAIFFPILKVLYNFNGCRSGSYDSMMFILYYRLLRRDLFWNLGLWHPYHHAYMTIWMNFCEQWLGQVVHLFWPQSNVMSKPKVRHIGFICILLRQITDEIIGPLRDLAAALERDPPAPFVGPCRL